MIGGLFVPSSIIVARSAEARQLPRDLSHLTAEQRAAYEAMRTRMMAALTYERVTVRGADAAAEWERLKDAGRGWPVVIGSDDDLERIANHFSIEDSAVAGVPLPGAAVSSPSQILLASENIRFPRDLRNSSGAYRSEDLPAPLGEWPASVAGGDYGLSVASDPVSGKPYDRVHILLLPAKHGWEAPAYLRWGDWNACPPPEYHVAALRHLNDHFGADLVGMGGDTLNLKARVRPTGRAQSLDLARDLYEYCPDIVDQGVGSIAALAAGLMTSEWWYFWWD